MKYRYFLFIPFIFILWIARELPVSFALISTSEGIVSIIGIIILASLSAYLISDSRKRRAKYEAMVNLTNPANLFPAPVGFQSPHVSSNQQISNMSPSTKSPQQVQMNFCEQCGFKFGVIKNFCPKCGTKIHKS